MEEKKQNNAFENFLRIVEFAGNKLPDITILFLIAFFIILGLSFLLSFFTFDYYHPTTHARIEVINMLSGQEVVKLLTKMVQNFMGFPPLGIIIVAVFGIGIAESSGFIRAILVKLLFFINKSTVVPAIIIISILFHIASDSAYVILMPIAALMFYILGRHPLAGIAASFAGLAGGFSASYTPSSIDPIMQSFTQQAARIMDPSYDVNVLCNYFISLGSTFGVLFICWFITVKVVEPFLWKIAPLNQDIPDQHIEPLTPQENKAFAVAISIMIGVSLLIVTLLIPEDSLLRSPTGSMTASDAPIMQMIVPLLFLFFAIPGYIYGHISGSFKTSKEFSNAMANALLSLLSFIAFAFFCAQFLYVFGNSNIGILIAVSGAEFLKSLNMAPQITIAGIIILTAFLNLIITSATSKWAILAPIFVPMLMAVSIAPELTQASFRISDSAINVVTPMFPFYPFIISCCQKYYKDTGIGTLSSMMLPYSLGLLVILTITLYFYWGLGIPLGFESQYMYTPTNQ